MKSLLLATAAVAVLAATPALAQDGVGSVGIAYSNTEVDVAGLSGEGDLMAIDAAVALPVTGDWTVTLDGAFAYAFDGAPASDDSAINGRIHATRDLGNVRIGGFAGGAELVDEQLWTIGAEAQVDLNDQLSLTGSAAWETIDGTGAEIWSVAGDAAWFVSPTFRLNAGAGVTTAKLGGGVDGDGWTANVGGEYQFAGTGMSVTAGYVRSEIEDIDLQADTFNVGLRFSFGGDLQTRQRSGADLGRTVAGLGSLAGAF